MSDRKFRAWYEPPYCSENEPCMWMAENGNLVIELERDGEDWGQ